MEFEYTVQDQDLKAVINALDQDDFRGMNIFANRVMSNAAIVDNKRLGIVGFFLKDVALLLSSIQRRETGAIATAKSAAKDFVDPIPRKVQDKEMPLSELWKQYHEFRLAFKKFEMDKVEEKVYVEQSSNFTDQAMDWMVRFLVENRTSLTDPQNLFLKGILNEASRLFKSHGGSIRTLRLISLITALDRVNDYVRYTSLRPENFSHLAEGKILPLAELVTQLATTQQDTESGSYDDLLWDLIKKWREYFIIYYELLSARRPQGEVELSEELQQKLTKAVSESLERELTKK